MHVCAFELGLMDEADMWRMKSGGMHNGFDTSKRVSEQPSVGEVSDDVGRWRRRPIQADHIVLATQPHVDSTPDST